jgi:MFS family permease
MLAVFPTVFGLPVLAMMPVFARDVLHVGAGGLGFLNSALGLGAIVATLSIASLGNLSKKGPLLIAACFTLGCFLILFSQSRWVPLSLAALLFVGASRMSFMALTNTTIQLTVPDQYRGRVMSLLALDFGLTPLGTLLAGTIATYWGVQIAITLFGLICVTAGVVAWLRLKAFKEVAT